MLLSRNRPEFLRRALQSLAQQSSYVDYVLVSDDSDEDTRSQVEELVGSFSFAKYQRGPRRGLGANENACLTDLRSGAGWVLYVGDDVRFPRDFIKQSRTLLAEFPADQIVTGSEIIGERRVLPTRLSFFGYQKIPYAALTSGTEVEAVVIQATWLPLEPLGQLRWLEVSAYGSDEVDMAFKLRALKLTFRYAPELWLFHDRAEIGRQHYEEEAQVARIYVNLKRYAVYHPSKIRFVSFALLAPVQLALAQSRRGQFASLLKLHRICLRAYRAFWNSRKLPWQLT